MHQVNYVLLGLVPGQGCISLEFLETGCSAHGAQPVTYMRSSLHHRGFCGSGPDLAEQLCLQCALTCCWENLGKMAKLAVGVGPTGNGFSWKCSQRFSFLGQMLTQVSISEVKCNLWNCSPFFLQGPMRQWLDCEIFFHNIFQIILLKTTVVRRETICSIHNEPSQTLEKFTIECWPTFL